MLVPLRQQTTVIRVVRIDGMSDFVDSTPPARAIAVTLINVRISGIDLLHRVRVDLVIVVPIWRRWSTP